MDPDWSYLGDLYKQGIDQLAIRSLPQFSSYRHYLERLLKWNTAYNLTAVREPENMVKQHVLESLAVLPWLKGKSRLDIGTGAGIPGLILAIAEPESHWVLLDSNVKKTRFIKQMILELGLENVSVHHQRVQDHQTDECYETVISRAFSHVTQYYKISKRLLSVNGRILAMKRGKPEQELQQLSAMNISYEFHYLPVLVDEKAASVVAINLL